ncbi:hypothetical protein PFLUV_G00215200 [Perca fluviatilis]|uniref:Uncharacterized protein n=1 Tax=Perca fluviatilis TaxID=8168 RepID=A0A6A5E7Z2_PERFL|nr:hypothetical protein PFLUV_G00215200 [Perca fluviatilis]
MHDDINNTHVVNPTCSCATRDGRRKRRQGGRDTRRRNPPDSRGSNWKASSWQVEQTAVGLTKPRTQ